ncbi:phospholipase A2 inhibitor and Ly6/PLAUR domain-containing protein-like [Notothenia coriiceps]|uniref:Phospholipase A2 inhibitor and Ly6/PLAUR domain-containing protein-like n=1 Tax=Notothenia coriiceps TaxID=8208 RepID=A0A6I9NQX0_9TELE|nr:PREDICTED: phospholipase A2 inhibitor and Ly6/PLAUR domain-containing protein-like [Notothenia coriiceps]
MQHFHITMKLILSLTVIWMLSSSAGALMCKNDTATSVTCKSNEQCATAMVRATIQGLSGGKKSCVSSSVCEPNNQTFSFKSGQAQLTAFVHCCKTDNCNSVNVSATINKTENNLMCYMCDGDQSTVCNKTVQCKGNEDRCVKGTAHVDGKDSEKFSGCASKNTCGAASQLGFLTGALKFDNGPHCCDTKLCNSAWTVKLSVVPFWVGLLLFVVL